MKARITQNLNGNSSGVVLSVGMIVKNEEKYLEKCLTALKPLLDAVPSELVIVDTGSTDKTVEIAERFTDKVFHFEWINDFSAARNFGLEKCTGEWFMFIDADEIFDADLSEIIGFFNDRVLLGRYDGAQVLMKSYSDPGGSDWSAMALTRLIKRMTGLRFVNPIHEAFSVSPESVRNLKTVVHHWGYAYETSQEKDNKKQRNLVPLLEELKKAPDDLRIRVHILQELKGDEYDEFFEQTLKTAVKQTENVWAMCVFMLNVLRWFNKKEYEKTISCADDYFKLYRNKPKNALCLDIYMVKAASLQKMEKYDEALKAADNYFRLYKAYTENRLDRKGLGLVQISYCMPEYYDEAKAFYERLLSQAGKLKVRFDAAVNPVTVKIIPAAPVLSVGMIVKNEEKYLEKCLTALKPLLDAVPSELVIVDTGSADKTVEIAERFTDKVFHFEWINDFSAARNFGLEKCTGEWFMFIDADEIFDADLSEIIGFFTNKTLKNKYGSVNCIIKNYSKPDDSEWHSFASTRIVKRLKNLRFINPVHEFLSFYPEPLYNLKTIIHHHGYAHETDEGRIAKKQRDLPILREELEKNPDDLRIRLQIINYLDNRETKEFFTEILEKVRKNPKDIYARTAMARMIQYYFESGEREKTLSHIDEFFKLFGKTKENILSPDIYAAKGMILHTQGKHAEAKDAFENYFRLLKLHKSGKLNLTGLGSMTLPFCEPEAEQKVRTLYNETLSRIGGKAHEIILSVGMIVKNEEKYLEKCLAALKPLLDAVPSELVIVDTGSTDKTVEIAKRFTDKIYFFEWINDFAAARNFGLEKCTGEWFMYIDADEIFEDLSLMIEFFGNPLNHKDFNCVCYTIRNFDSADCISYNDINSYRIFRRTPDLRFEGVIHEGLANWRGPVAHLDVTALHYGYTYETEDSYLKKGVRNMVLLEAELNEKPDDLRVIQHYIQNSPFRTEKVRMLTEKAVEIAGNLNSVYVKPAYINAFSMYVSENRDKEALNIIDKLIKKVNSDDAVLTDAYGLKGELLFRLEKYAEAAASINNYLKYFKEFKDGKLNTDVLTVMPFGMTTEEKKKELEAALSVCIEKMDFEREARLILDALKNNKNITELIQSMNYERIKAHISSIAQKRGDLPPLALGFLNDDFYCENIFNLVFGILLFEAAAKAGNRESKENKEKINKKLTLYASRYIRQVYNPDLLNDDDIGILPEAQRMGYFGSGTV